MPDRNRSTDRNDFQRSVAELQKTSKRISSGLDSVLEMLEKVAKQSENFASPSPQEGDTPAFTDLRDVLSHIRGQITALNEAGREFDNKLNRHATELQDLNAQLKESRKNALIDPLTGIPNRRAFEVTLTDLLAHFQAFNGLLSVLIGDVDDFKAVNDRLGHAIGDQVLKLTAVTLRDGVRSTDMVARWGGDEFVAILPDTEVDTAAATAEQVLKTLASKSIINRQTGELLGKIAMSMGATQSKSDDTSETIMARADLALYEAKRRGKNQVRKG